MLEQEVLIHNHATTLERIFATEVLKGAAVLPIIGKSVSPSICVTFPNAREAALSEFRELKLYAEENGFNFREDSDIRKQKSKHILTMGNETAEIEDKVYFYILTDSDCPF